MTPGSSIHGDSPDKNNGVLSSKPGIEPRSLALQADSLPGSPKRTTIVLIALVSTYVILVAQCFKAIEPSSSQTCLLEGLFTLQNLMEIPW